MTLEELLSVLYKEPMCVDIIIRDEEELIDYDIDKILDITKENEYRDLIVERIKIRPEFMFDLDNISIKKQLTIWVRRDK